MNHIVFKVVFLGAFLCEVLEATNSAGDKTTSLLKKCPKAQCLVSYHNLLSIPCFISMSSSTAKFSPLPC